MATVRIPIYSRKYPGLYALVDDDDAELVSRFRWNVDMTWPDRPYGKCPHGGRMHRLIAGARRGELVDHINGNTLDNRKSNLRITDNTGNARNAKQKSVKKTSRFKGVCWEPRRSRWRALITVNRKVVHVGYFEDERDAAVAYDHAALSLHGAFARTNADLGYLDSLERVAG